jgi:hypothetical protein
MNPIHVLSAQPWVAHLGWTLVHFLWQGLSIAALYAGVRRGIAGKVGPNTRYLLACAALGAMLSAPLATWGLMGQSDTNPDNAYRIRNTPRMLPLPAPLAPPSGCRLPFASPCPA